MNVSHTTERRSLDEMQQGGCSTREALDLFDALPASEIPSMFGRWRGSSLPTEHPWDGLLSALGWYGKELLDEENVHPLLFSSRGGARPLSPRLFPVGLFAGRASLPPLPWSLFSFVRPLLGAARPAARLRKIEHRGVLTAAMIYDHLPIIDIFRSIDGETRLGVMDLRGMSRPFFFVLRRER